MEDSTFTSEWINFSSASDGNKKGTANTSIIVHPPVELCSSVAIPCSFCGAMSIESADFKA